MTVVWYVLGSGWMRLNLNLLVYPRGRENDCSNGYHACDDVTPWLRLVCKCALLKEMIDTRVAKRPVARLTLFHHQTWT